MAGFAIAKIGTLAPFTGLLDVWALAADGRIVNHFLLVPEWLKPSQREAP
jgi:hypothetical protein